MAVDFKLWKHVFKLDPARRLSDNDLERICTSTSDAIMLGGSSDITYENTVELLARIRRYEMPCVLEVSHRDAVVAGFDLYLIPIVLNAQHLDWVIGHQHQALKYYGNLMNWEEIVTEGYIILNSQATVAQLTQAQTQLDSQDVIAYARMAENMFHMPIIYIEYSGQFGDMHLLAQVREHIEQARLFYGGGIDSLAKAKQAAAIADTIVVGNIIYSNLEQALETLKLK